MLNHEFEFQGKKFRVTIIDDGSNFVIQGYRDGKPLPPRLSVNKIEAAIADQDLGRNTLNDIACYVKDCLQGKNRTEL